jgi:hypothetical protein
MMVVCPHCDTRVMPMKDGRCPACRRGLSPDAPEPPAKPTREPPPTAKATTAQKIGAVVGFVAAMILLEIILLSDAGEGGFDINRVILFGIVGALGAGVGAVVGGAFGPKRD